MGICESNVIKHAVLHDAKLWCGACSADNSCLTRIITRSQTLTASSAGRLHGCSYTGNRMITRAFRDLQTLQSVNNKHIRADKPSLTAVTEMSRTAGDDYQRIMI